MTAEKAFFFILSLITLTYAIKVQVDLFINRKKVVEVKGQIINLEYVLPEKRHINAKLATFQYYVNGRRYISENRIKLPISANIGDSVDIRYFKDNPSVLYINSMTHYYLAIIAALACFLLGMIL